MRAATKLNIPSAEELEKEIQEAEREKQRKQQQQEQQQRRQQEQEQRKQEEQQRKQTATQQPKQTPPPQKPPTQESVDIKAKKPETQQKDTTKQTTSTPPKVEQPTSTATQQQTKQTAAQQPEQKQTTTQQPEVKQTTDTTQDTTTAEKVEEEKTFEEEQKPTVMSTALVHVPDDPEERRRWWENFFSGITGFAKTKASKQQKGEKMSNTNLSDEEASAIEKMKEKRPDFTLGGFQAEMDQYIPTAMRYIVRGDPLAKVYLTKEFGMLQAHKFSGEYKPFNMEDLIKSEEEKRKAEKQAPPPTPEQKKANLTPHFETIDLVNCSPAEFLTARIIHNTPMIFLMFKTEELRGEPWSNIPLIKKIEELEEQNIDTYYERKALRATLESNSEVIRVNNFLAVLWDRGDQMWKKPDH
eukprot:TRINITY_DN6219_c0_g2_i1.p1 TRINITY_DN6219_c0_g2~~TRINITY_DN6219_c0_g2_i1.p1  ORF type:complete len:441 (-),score=156.52 TRINITY_DN6219_c0_g2_i1:96-1334(-)